MNILHSVLLAILATSVAANSLRSNNVKGAHFFSFAEIAELSKKTEGALDPKVAVVGTNFDTPVQVPLRNKKACNGCEPMPFDEMLPIERKVVLAQHALDRLNMARSIEENALKIRLQRERTVCDDIQRLRPEHRLWQERRGCFPLRAPLARDRGLSVNHQNERVQKGS